MVRNIEARNTISMAACENPLVENPILIGTLYPWKQMNPKTPSLGDIFPDPIPPLFHHIADTPSSSSSSSSQQPDEDEEEVCMEEKEEVDEKEEVKVEEEEEEDEEGMRETAAERRQYYYLPQRRIRKGVYWRSRSLGGQFPPPISSISVSSGKPWVYFKSYRREGRFVLKKIMVPTLELLHASRENGRLRMHFIHRSDDRDHEEKVQEGLLEEQERDHGALP